MAIDTAELLDWLDNTSTYWDSLKTGDPTADQRLEDAIKVLYVVKTRVPNFEVRIKKTPIKEIEIKGVRRNDPSTSIDAAFDAKMSKNRQELYKSIYNTLMKIGPSTDDELRDYFDDHGMSYGHFTSVVKRRGELADFGWIEATNLKRKSNLGKLMTVWRALP